MMRRTIVVLVLLCAFLIPIASAQTGNTEQLRQGFNERSSQFPGILDPLIGHQKLNMYVNSSGGGQQQTMAMEMRGRNMTTIRREPFVNQTVDVWTTEDALVSIIQAQNKTREVNRQIEQGNLDYQVYGFVNKLRLQFVKAVT